MLRLTGLLAIAVLIIVSATLIISYRVKKDVGYKIVSIGQGERLEEVAKKLNRDGLLISKSIFLFFAWWRADEIKAGEYEFYGEVSIEDILRKITKGEVILRRATIPEGVNMFEIAETLEKERITSRDGFLKAATDKEFIRKLGVESETAEGFLYPDTYLFTTGEKPRKVVKTMIENFFKKIGEERLKKMKRRNLSLKFVVTLASIIEKESLLESEKRIISSVYWNRLRRGFKLEADPTVMYWLVKTGKVPPKEPPKPEYLRKDNPYNTYTRGGLPPTPICNPSLSSIDAAMNPADTSYLFFVAKGDGSHLFAKTYSEHLRNIRLLTR